jgi:hypothetical protein
MRERHPEIYFQCMVKLALAHPVELYPPGGSDRRYTPEEIMAKLEDRVGPEGRKMFERFMRRVRWLEEHQLTMSSSDGRLHDGPTGQPLSLGPLHGRVGER